MLLRLRADLGGHGGCGAGRMAAGCLRPKGVVLTGKVDGEERLIAAYTLRHEGLLAVIQSLLTECLDAPRPFAKVIHMAPACRA